MAKHHNPRIVTSGLQLCIDAANIKSLPYHPRSTDHGISDWYCFVSGTATYSCSEPNTAIYQVTDLGVVSTVVASSSSPQRGTISVTAGYRYYGNKPIFLTVEDQQHSIAPISMASKLFIYLANRVGAEAGTVYFYAPFGSATVTMYTGGTGINGTATSTISLTKGQSGTFTISALNWYYFTSTTPVIATAGQLVAGNDKTILSPAVLTSYQRYQTNYVTSIGGTPSTVSAYVIADTTYPVMSMQIADGSGGDAAQGLGYEYLCDRYSWGNVLSDYTIVAPYANTVVTTFYWSGTAWVVWETHSLSGTKLSPAQVQRDGTAGPGVTATNINGTAANMASGATLWKWESNNPIYLCINDSADDELSMLGWMSTRTSRTVSDVDTTWRDVSGNSANLSLYGDYSISDDSVTFTRTSTTPKHGGGATGIGSGSLTSTNFLYNDHTWEIWFKINDRTPGNYDATEGNSILSVYQGYHAGFFYSSDTIYYQMWSGTSTMPTCASWSLGTSGTNVIQGNWYQIVVTRSGNVFTPYVNGVVLGSGSTNSPSPTGVGTGNNICLGSAAQLGAGSGSYVYYSKVSIANMKMYNRALTAAEISQNFNALRGRFGI